MRYCQHYEAPPLTKCLQCEADLVMTKQDYEKMMEGMAVAHDLATEHAASSARFMRVMNKSTGAWVDYDLSLNTFTVFPVESSAIEPGDYMVLDGKRHPITKSSGKVCVDFPSPEKYSAPPEKPGYYCGLLRDDCKDEFCPAHGQDIR